MTIQLRLFGSLPPLLAVSIELGRQEKGADGTGYSNVLAPLKVRVPCRWELRAEWGLVQYAIEAMIARQAAHACASGSRYVCFLYPTSGPITCYNDEKLTTFRGQDAVENWMEGYCSLLPCSVWPSHTRLYAH